MSCRFALAVGLVVCAASCHGAQESLAGRWEGVAQIADSKTHAIVDFGVDANGSLSATVTLPDDRLLSKPLTNVRNAPPNVHFELRTSERTIAFDLTRSGDVIAGTIHGGEVSGPVSFRRIGAVPDAPYGQQEVRFRNGEVTLAGTLLIPPSKGRHPAVVLIHGSSTPSRDDFRFYADLFARQGIAALIYDKRDVGGDIGGASRVDLRDLAGDALAAVALLQSRDDIDPRQIGLWGHSQGGSVATIAAAQSDAVAFVISFSGPGVTYAEFNTYADTTRLRALGFPDADLLDAARALARVYEYVRHGGDARALQSFLDESSRKRWASKSTLPRRVPSPEEMRTWVQWRNLDFDPGTQWERIKVPALVMFGELDDVVPVKASAERIDAALKRAGNRDVTIRIFPKASHTIQPAPDFLDLLMSWTTKRVRTVN